MAQPLAVDATCLVSAILGGRAREVFFSDQFELFSPQATLFEVPKHIPWLATRLRKPELQLFEEFQLFPIVACQPEDYDRHVPRATQLITQRDLLDIPLLALALARRYPIWSDDRDFEGIAEIQLMKTADLLRRLTPQ
jgi:predicted nucleic acid-binding protein